MKGGALNCMVLIEWIIKIHHTRAPWPVFYTYLDFLTWTVDVHQIRWMIVARPQLIYFGKSILFAKQVFRNAERRRFQPWWVSFVWVGEAFDDHHSEGGLTHICTDWRDVRVSPGTHFPGPPSSLRRADIKVPTSSVSLVARLASARYLFACLWMAPSAGPRPAQNSVYWETPKA